MIALIGDNDLSRFITGRGIGATRAYFVSKEVIGVMTTGARQALLKQGI